MAALALGPALAASENYVRELTRVGPGYLSQEKIQCVSLKLFSND